MEICWVTFLNNVFGVIGLIPEFLVMLTLHHYAKKSGKLRITTQQKGLITPLRQPIRNGVKTVSAILSRIGLLKNYPPPPSFLADKYEKCFEIIQPSETQVYSRI